MLRGLSRIHLHGIAHRDLAMPNLMLSFADDAVQIGDFGLASSAASCLLDRIVTQLAGRSPEVLLSAPAGEKANKSTNLPAPAYTMDLWSAGAVCFALYFASHPFTARADDADGMVQCLQSMIDLLGSPESSWPAITQLPLWSKIGSKLRPAARVEPRVAFRSPGFAKRLVPEDHGAIDLVSSLLEWDPLARAMAAHAAQSCLARAAGVSAAARAPEVAAAGDEGGAGEGAAAGVSAAAGDDVGGVKRCMCAGGCGMRECTTHGSGSYGPPRRSAQAKSP